MIPTRKTGFSLIEVLVVISVLAIVAGTAFSFISGIKESSDDLKLDSDVRKVNSAVGIYKAMGGSLDGLTDPQEVLDKLKTVVNADLANRMPGLGGSVIDPRLEAVIATEIAEEDFSEWNPATQKFEVVTDGIPKQNIKIKAFALGDEPTVIVAEARDATMKYSKEDTWVWDYQDRSAGGPTGPTVFAVADVPDSPIPPPTGVPPPPAKLDPIEFSIPGGDHPDTSFPLSLTLSDPNASGSEIVYWINSDPPAVYAGPLSISPDDVVSTYANSLDDALWIDSITVSWTYTEEVTAPDIDFTMSVSTSP